MTPLQKAAIGGFLEILSMSAPSSASYVEMMRCYALCGWNTTVFKDTAARYKFADGTGALVDVIDADMIATLQQGPGLGSGNQTLTGTGGQPMGISTTGSSQIQDIGDQIV